MMMPTARRGRLRMENLAGDVSREPGGPREADAPTGLEASTCPPGSERSTPSVLFNVRRDGQRPPRHKYLTSRRPGSPAKKHLYRTYLLSASPGGDSSHSRSVFESDLAKLSSPSKSFASALLRCCNSQMRSSTVPSVSKRYAMTVRVWPMRWVRSIACASIAGFHHGSNRIT